MHAMVDFIICLRHLDGPVVPLIACTLAPDVNPGRLSKMADLPKFIGPLVAKSLIELRLQVGLSPGYSRSLAESCESALHSHACPVPGSCRCGSASFRAAPYSIQTSTKRLGCVASHALDFEVPLQHLEAGSEPAQVVP
jgi:hypothetical protein